MGSILKTLAFAAGAGVAIGLCTTSERRPSPRRAPRREDVLDIEPLLDRLESVERSSEIAELTRRIDAQDAEIARLRQFEDRSSASIDALRDRAAETDANIQRLITAIERLCERVPAPAPAAAAPGPVLLPFESHLREASQREDAVPQFRSKIFQEPEPEPEAEVARKKSRFPIARIFGMIALIVLTQVLR